MVIIHTPTNNRHIVASPGFNRRNLRRNLRWLSRNPDCATDKFSAAMVELATALRRADRADRWERQLSA